MIPNVESVFRTPIRHFCLASDYHVVPGIMHEDNVNQEATFYQIKERVIKNIALSRNAACIAPQI